MQSNIPPVGTGEERHGAGPTPNDGNRIPPAMKWMALLAVFVLVVAIVVIVS